MKIIILISILLALLVQLCSAQYGKSYLLVSLFINKLIIMYIMRLLD